MQRSTIENLALASAMLMVGVACRPSVDNPNKPGLVAPSSRSSAESAVRPPTLSSGTLSAHLRPELIQRFALQHLADVRVSMAQIPTSDQKPTFIYVYDRSVGLNIDGVRSAYETVSPANLARYTEALKKDIGPQGYRPDPSHPESSVFRYYYGEKTPDSIDVGIYSAAQTTRERHMLIVNKNDVPDWAQNTGAITRHHILQGSGLENSGVLATVISAEDLKRFGPNLDIQLNKGILTEICQQTILVIGYKGNIMSRANEVTGTISQEGFCNGFGMATLLKRLGTPSNEAARLIESTVLAGINGSPNMRLFPTTETAYSLLPSNGPVAGTR